MENKQKGFLQRIGQIPKAAKGALLSLPVIGALSGGAQAAQNQPPADPHGITQIAQAEASDPLIAEAHAKRTQILEKQGLLKMSQVDYDKYFKKGETKQSETANNCYALTAIDALQHSPQMETMARSSMKRDTDGSWDITLPLMNDEGEVTKVTPKEMGRQANPYYMQPDSRFPGGKDTRQWLEPPDSPEGIRALEAAMIKKKFGTDENGSVRRDKAELGFPMDALDEIGGDNFKKNQIKSPTKEVELPTGEKIDALTKFSYGKPEEQAEVDNFLDKFNPNSDIAVAGSTRLPLHDNQDGNLLKSHAYSIRDTDPVKKTVTLADPRDTSKEFTVSYKKFKDNFATIQSIRPDNAEILKNMDNIRQYNMPGRVPSKPKSPPYSPQNPADQIGSIPPGTAASPLPASGSVDQPAPAYKTPQTEIQPEVSLNPRVEPSSVTAQDDQAVASSPVITRLTKPIPPVQRPVSHWHTPQSPSPVITTPAYGSVVEAITEYSSAQEAPALTNSAGDEPPAGIPPADSSSGSALPSEAGIQKQNFRRIMPISRNNLLTNRRSNQQRSRLSNFAHKTGSKLAIKAARQAAVTAARSAAIAASQALIAGIGALLGWLGIVFLIAVFIVIFIFVLSTKNFGGTNFAAASPSASLDDCGEKYAKIIARNRFLQENFGDPDCDFTIGGMDSVLRQIDPARADKWHFVIKGESGFQPNAWADPGIGTPNPYGAWGLLQMGSRFQSNNSADRGDVKWNAQISNAIGETQNFLDNNPYRYWCQWRIFYPDGDGLGHSYNWGTRARKC